MSRRSYPRLKERLLYSVADGVMTKTKGVFYALRLSSASSNCRTNDGDENGRWRLQARTIAKSAPSKNNVLRLDRGGLVNFSFPRHCALLLDYRCVTITALTL